MSPLPAATPSVSRLEGENLAPILGQQSTQFLNIRLTPLASFARRSYALMHKTGFELMDMLLCCKFAEGDSRILQMKLMRDRLKKVKKDGVAGTLSQVFGNDGTEAIKALKLANKLNVGRDLAKMEKAMNDNWEEVYELARIVEQRHINSTPPSSFIEPITERFSPAEVYYDLGWKDKVVTGAPAAVAAEEEKGAGAA